jgi:hypothetical protein
MSDLFSLSGSLDWNLVRRSTIRREEFRAWPTQIYTVDSPNLIIGTGIESGRPTWKFAGNLMQFVPTKPDSLGLFGIGVEVERYPIYLGRYQHIKLAEYSPRPYAIKFDPARWLTDLTIELWYYDEAL